MAINVTASFRDFVEGHTARQILFSNPNNFRGFIYYLIYDEDIEDVSSNDILIASGGIDLENGEYKAGNLYILENASVEETFLMSSFENGFLQGTYKLSYCFKKELLTDEDGNRIGQTAGADSIIWVQPVSVGLFDEDTLFLEIADISNSWLDANSVDTLDATPDRKSFLRHQIRAVKSEIQSMLFTQRAKYDLDFEFNRRGTDRNTWLLELTTNLVVCKIMSKNAFTDDSSMDAVLRVKRMEQEKIQQLRDGEIEVPLRKFSDTYEPVQLIPHDQSEPYLG